MMMNKTVLSALMGTALALTALALAACRGSAGGAENPAEAVLQDGRIDGRITVSAYDSMAYRAFLEEAARRFQEKYPGTTVQVETAAAMPEIRTAESGGGRVMSVTSADDPQSRSDYISRVNTNLMSGKGADVYAIDILPLQKYAGSGQLENLDNYIRADSSFHRDAYRGNIIDASYYAGGLYFMPMDYSFSYFAYDRTLVPAELAAQFGTGSRFSTEDLVELAKPFYQDGGPKLFSSYASVNGMIRRRLDEYYQSIIDLEQKQARFTDGRLASLVGETLAWGEAGYIPQSVSGGANPEALMRGGPPQPTDRFFFKPKLSSLLISQFTRGLSANRMMISSDGEAQGVEDDDEIAGIQANINGIVPYTYEQAYGINANSPNKRTAWEFIKFLLSDEMQLSGALSPTAMPINNGVRMQKAELVFTGAFMGRPSQPVTDAQQAALENYRIAVEALSDQINGYVLQDTIINDMFMGELKYYVSGERSLEETARTLQNKVDLYLSE